MSAMYLNYVGRGGSKVVSVFAFYFDDPSLTPDEVCSFSLFNLLEKSENKLKRGRDWPNLKSHYLPTLKSFSSRINHE